MSLAVVNRLVLPALNDAVPCPACGSAGRWHLELGHTKQTLMVWCGPCGWSYSEYLPGYASERWGLAGTYAAEWKAWFQGFGEAMKAVRRAQDRADVYERQEALFDLAT